MTDPTTPQDHRMPRWVKAFVVAGVILAVLVVVTLLAGGEHSPGRHLGLG